MDTWIRLTKGLKGLRLLVRKALLLRNNLALLHCQVSELCKNVFEPYFSDIKYSTISNSSRFPNFHVFISGKP